MLLRVLWTVGSQAKLGIGIAPALYLKPSCLGPTSDILDPSQGLAFSNLSFQKPLQLVLVCSYVVETLLCAWCLFLWFSGWESQQ